MAIPSFPYPSRNLSRLAAIAASILGAAIPVRSQGTNGCPEPKAADFVKVELIKRMNEPMEMAVLPDGRVLYLERLSGKIQLYKAGALAPVTAGKLTVSGGTGNTNDGMLGLALDPSFADNGWFYLYYSPAAVANVNRLSRFRLAGDAVDLASERVILDVKTHRTACCHSAGSLAFGPGGNLYLATGDNTTPTMFHQPAALGTSSNTGDLRGKILRIMPLPFPDSRTPAPGPGSTYEIPAGNLHVSHAWAEGEAALVRPEIYTMGHRNPFRISVDAVTGWLAWGDVGPDAPARNDTTGDPAGVDELGLATGPGYFGWPYFVGDKSYAVGGKAVDPLQVINTSPLNTGAKALPPAKVPGIWYTDRAELSSNGGAVKPASGITWIAQRTAMAGPIYRYRAFPASARKLPPYLDGKLIFYEWSQNFMALLSLDSEAKVTKFEPLFGGMKFNRAMDMEVGPDGSLYVLEYGTVWRAENNDAGLYRVEYRGEHPDCLALSIADGRADTRLLPPGAGLGGIRFPPGMRRMLVHDLSGRRLWEYRRQDASAGETAELPSALGSRVLKLSFLP